MNFITFLHLQAQEHYYVKWSKTFIDLLKSTNDPRLGKVAVTQLYLSDASKLQSGSGNADPSLQKGMPNGKDLSGIAGRTIASDPSFTTFPDYSSPSSFMIKRNGPTFIMTYAETELLLAVKHNAGTLLLPEALQHITVIV